MCTTHVSKSLCKGNQLQYTGQQVYQQPCEYSPEPVVKALETSLYP